MQRLVLAEWGGGEIRAVVGALLGRRANDGPALGGLLARLAIEYPAQSAWLVNQGRVGLAIALRSFAELRPLRDEVLFPAYICPSVIEAIEVCGLRPVAVDILPDLNLDPASVAQRLSSRTLAVVGVHMYGAPAAIHDLESLCRAAGVFLVDDAAQVAGVALEGRKLGSFGSCGLLSFSQSKTIVAGIGHAGGVLLGNDPALEPALRARWAALAQPAYSVADLALFLRDGLFASRTKTATYYAGRLRRLAVPARPSEPPPWRAPPWRAHRMANALAAAALCQFDSLAERVHGRIEVAAAFQSRLATHPGCEALLVQFAPGRYLTRLMLRTPEGTTPEMLRHRLAARGVQTRRSYPLDTRYTSGLVNATRLGASLIEVPSHSQMPAAAIDAVVAAVAASLGDGMI